MHFSDSLSFVEEAKEAFFKAENENQDWKRKVDLYVVASKRYLSAANSIVGDRSAVNALVFLSSSALFKADVVNSMIQTASFLSGQEHGTGLGATSKSTESTINVAKDLTATEAEPIGHASLSGRVLLLSTDKRNTLGNSSKMRSSGLTGVPKAGSMAPSDAAYDLFFLEKKLAELGLMAGSGSSSYRNNGNTLTSALGESFMLLSTSSSRTKGGRALLTARNAVTMPLGPRDAMRVDPSNLPKSGSETSGLRYEASTTQMKHQNSSNSPVTIPNTIPVTGPYGGMKKEGMPPTARSSGNSAGNKSVGTFWLPNPIDILTWRGIKAAPSPPCSDDLKEKPIKDYSVYENSQCDLNWNDDQSVYGLPAMTRGETDRKSVSESQTVSASAIQGYFVSPQTGNAILENEEKMENEKDVNNTNGTLRESELRLLQSIKRLGDENFSLLQRIDLLSAVEAKNLDLHKEMTSFKKEYQERFCRLKEVLREFQRKNSRDGNSRTFGFEFNTIIGAQPGEIFDNKDETSGSKQDGDLKAQGVTREKIHTDEQESVRQQQLERTVLALVKRLEESKIELDKRDRLIGKYEKYYRQLKRDAERRETERRGGIPGPEFEKHSPPNLAHAPSSSSAPPHQPPSVNSSSSSSSTSSGVKIGPVMASNSPNIALGSSGNTQRQQPRAPSMVARNKHPSISTLETTLGLQRDRAGASGVRYAHSGGHK